jgi:hypothetical protein
MKAAARIAGLLSLFSLLLWAFTGIPLWSSVNDSVVRGYVVGAIHIVGLFLGAMSLDNNIWEDI